ncbi:MAG: lysostaphin resistance A-like protein [Enterococcus sp.]
MKNNTTSKVTLGNSFWKPFGGICLAIFVSMYAFIKLFSVVLALPFDDVQSLTSPSLLFVNIGSWVACLLTVILFASVSKFGLKDMGMLKEKVPTRYLTGVLIGVALMGSIFLLNFVFGFIDVTVNPNINWLLIVLLFVFFMIQGFTEEVMLRGYLFGTLQKKFGLWTSVIISSILFALLHSLNDGVTLLSIFNLFLFGVTFALTYKFTGNLFIVGAMHTIWNFLMGPIFGVQVSGEVSESVFKTVSSENSTLFNGGSFGFEGGLIVTAIGLIFLMILLTRKVGIRVTVPVPANQELGNGLEQEF